MRLLTHNFLQNNTKEAKGKGHPLKIVKCDNVRVDECEITEENIDFCRNMLPSLHWEALVEAAKALGIPTLPPTLTQDLAQDEAFLKALFHVLMHVHLVDGTMECPITGRQFDVKDEIPILIIDEEECPGVRY